MTLKNVAHILATGVAASAMLMAPAFAQGNRGTVQGVITDASGKPVEGAFVKLKNDQMRLTFMVTTRDKGQFSAPI